MELLLRFLIGGAVVSAFAVISDILKPKSFAGLFGAAPSVALATLFLTIHTDGAGFAAIEARSMIAGGAALLVYSVVTCRMLARSMTSVLLIASLLLAIWFGVAFGLWRIFYR